ncbi:MAG: HAD family hydrolase [bacterium]|nr:HAD family hydrolase [bacterium]MDO4527840.1 HAD family hydrolase [bacterium]
MRVVFFDIDGTLIEHRLGVDAIPASVLEQLERLHAQGDKLIICSGRPFAMIDESVALPIFDGFVTFNGGQVDVEDVTISRTLLGYGLAREVVDLFDELGCEYVLETAHHVYLNRNFPHIYAFFRQFLPPDFFTFDFDLEEVLTRTIKFEAAVSGIDYEPTRVAMGERLGSRVTVDEHGTANSFELYSSATSKATGIQKVLEHYGVGPQDAIGIGDGLNDIEMIRFCGTGVAMGNAMDALKAEADLVIGAVDEDGMARYLRTL